MWVCEQAKRELTGYSPQLVVCSVPTPRGSSPRTGTQSLGSMESTHWNNCSSGSRGTAKEVNAEYWHEPIAIPICDVNPTLKRAFRASGQWRIWKYRGRQLLPAHQTSRLSTCPHANSFFHPTREIWRKYLNLVFNARKHVSQIYARAFQPHQCLYRWSHRYFVDKRTKTCFANSWFLGQAWQTVRQRKYRAVVNFCFTDCPFKISVLKNRW